MDLGKEENSLKAIILAAGRGTRLNKYTVELPKCMLNFAGNTLIKRQIDTIRKHGIDNITIVTGYMSKKINYTGIKYFHNEKYATTNMIESLFCANSEMTDDIIVCYSDIIFEEEVLEKIINSNYDISVVVDLEWKKYWKIRYGKVNYDLESLKINNNRIIELGREEQNIDEIDGRFVGLIKFKKKVIMDLFEVYNIAKKKYSRSFWPKSKKPFKQGYMTDLLQEFIFQGFKVSPVFIKNKWLEFDTNEDYEIVNKLYEDNKLDCVFSL